MPIVTFLTDFGTRDGYVASIKGVVLGIAPGASLVDITHEVAPQDVAEAAFTLASCWRSFPPGTAHLVVVDPGVGSARRALAVAAAGQLFIAPDNGVLSLALAQAGPYQAVSLERRFRTGISATFHGRDLFAPAAAHLALGLPLEQLGPPVAEIILLPQAQPRPVAPEAWEGEVIAVDRFGNLITNFSEASVYGREARVLLCGCELTGIRNHYAQAPPGELLALIGSSGYLEVAANLGSAAERLGAGRGTPVRVTLRPA